MASLLQLPFLGYLHSTAESLFFHYIPTDDPLYYVSLKLICRYSSRVCDNLNVKPLIDPNLDALFLYGLP